MSDKPKIAHRRKARNLLVQALYQWQMTGNPVNEIEAQYRTDNTGKVDWDFFHDAFATVVGNAQGLDDIFVSLLDRKMEQLTPVELAVLRLGVYELKNRIDVPYKVVINESVDLARKFGATDSHKYINGVLDKAARQLRQVEVEASA